MNPLAELIRHYGIPPHTAWLDPSYSLFYYQFPPFTGSSSIPITHVGAVGYVAHAGYAVVFGEPLCPPSPNMKMKAELTDAFVDYCSHNNLRPFFMSCSEEFKELVARSNWVSMGVMKEELIKTVTNKTSTSIKKSCKKAKQAGVEIHEYYSDREIPGVGSDHESFRNEVMKLAQRWTEDRTGWQMYSNQVTPFASIGRRFYAIIPSNAPTPPVLVGFLTLARLDIRNGYFVEYNLTDPAAPQGTSESLMQAVIDAMKADQQTLSYGLTPVENISMSGPVGSIKRKIVKKAYAMFHNGKTDGKENFCRKFGIEQEQNLYVVCRKKDLGITMMLALFMSLNMKYVPTPDHDHQKNRKNNIDHKDETLANSATDCTKTRNWPLKSNINSPTQAPPEPLSNPKGPQQPKKNRPPKKNIQTSQKRDKLTDISPDGAFVQQIEVQLEKQIESKLTLEKEFNNLQLFSPIGVAAQ